MYELNTEHEITVDEYFVDHGSFGSRARFTIKATTGQTFKTFTSNFEKGDRLLVRVTDEHPWSPRVKICKTIN